MVNERAFVDVMHHAMLAELRDIFSDRDRKLAAIRTRDDAEAYRLKVKRAIRRSFGPMPKRTPLKAEVVGVIKQRGYRIERVRFESRPHFTVTANLYVPDGDGPFPCVLGACGHSLHGKAEPFYQQFCRTLAKRGYLTLIYDPIGQGERFQFEHLKSSDVDKPNPVVHEHNAAGNVQHLADEFFGAWRSWDGIRALDYLLSRKEADRSRVGVTGNSGGGTMATYLNALDDRFTMAAPSCFITSYLNNFENELPADSEQIPPGIIAAGVDHGDFLIAQAPRPVALIGQKDCFFDERGLMKTYEQVRAFYRKYNAADKVKLFIGEHGHGFHADGRLAMVRFFEEQLGRSTNVREPAGDVFDYKQLLVTKTGQVHDLPGERSVTAFTADAAKAKLKRTTKSAASVAATVTKTLKLKPRKKPPHYRVMRTKSCPAETPFNVRYGFAVETEHGYLATLQCWQNEDTSPVVGWMAQPRPTKAPMVYVPHVDTADDLAGDHLPVKTPELWTIDPRGIGLQRQHTCDGTDDFFAAYDADYFYAAHAIMFGDSLLRGRVHDVLASLDLLADRGAARIHLIGRGIGAVTAAIAGSLHPTVKAVTLINAPTSYADMATGEVNCWPLSVMARDVLKAFDLPDVYRALRGKKLKQVRPWRARMK